MAKTPTKRPVKPSLHLADIGSSAEREFIVARAKGLGVELSASDAASIFERWASFGPSEGASLGDFVDAIAALESQPTAASA